MKPFKFYCSYSLFPLLFLAFTIAALSLTSVSFGAGRNPPTRAIGIPRHPTSKAPFSSSRAIEIPTSPVQPRALGEGFPDLWHRSSPTERGHLSVEKAQSPMSGDSINTTTPWRYPSSPPLPPTYSPSGSPRRGDPHIPSLFEGGIPKPSDKLRRAYEKLKKTALWVNTTKNRNYEKAFGVAYGHKPLQGWYAYLFKMVRRKEVDAVAFQIKLGATRSVPGIPKQYMSMIFRYQKTRRSNFERAQKAQLVGVFPDNIVYLQDLPKR